MGRAELIKRISGKSNVPIYVCSKVIDALEESITEGLIEDKKVFVKGFFLAETKMGSSRKARNPVTDKVEIFPPSRVVKIRFGERLKNAVIEGL